MRRRTLIRLAGVGAVAGWAIDVSSAASGAPDAGRADGEPAGGDGSDAVPETATASTGTTPPAGPAG